MTLNKYKIYHKINKYITSVGQYNISKFVSQNALFVKFPKCLLQAKSIVHVFIF